MTPCTCHPGKTCASAASCAAARETEFGEAVSTEQKLSEADRKDAERYRFIRDYDSPSNILAICRWEEIGWDGQFVIEHDPDAAIDAAQQKGGAV